MISLQVQGLKEIQEQLKDLFPALKRQRVVQKAVRKAMQPVLADAKAHVARDTSLLHDSIRLGSAEERDTFAAGLLIAVSKGGSTAAIRKAAKAALNVGKGKGAGKAVKFANYARRMAQRQSAHWRWHFVEKGVPAHGIAARPFLRPALDKNAQAAVDSLVKDLDKAIEKELKRRARKAKKR